VNAPVLWFLPKHTLSRPTGSFLYGGFFGFQFPLSTYLDKSSLLFFCPPPPLAQTNNARECVSFSPHAALGAFLYASPFPPNYRISEARKSQECLRLVFAF